MSKIHASDPAPCHPLRCPRCGAAGAGYAGCAGCRGEGVAVNLVPPLADLRGLDLGGFAGGPWGWPATVPADRQDAPLLGEGSTPNVPVAAAGGQRLWVKDEGRNPTGSHKDRAMTVGLAKALASGAATVLAASSGNAGAAAAAYAARAGLRCVVLTTPAIPWTLARQIGAFGAVVVALADTATRDRVMAAAVAQLGWYPLTNFVEPVAGGNPYGIEGYKSVAYELARDFGDTLDAVVVPTSRADLLAGIERGYRELATAGLIAGGGVPRLVAAETATAAAFAAALRHQQRGEQERTVVAAQPSPAVSIGSTTPSWQGLHALWATNGTAIAVEVNDYLEEHRRLPATSGLFLEVSAAVAVTAARRLLKQGARRVVAIGTATGLKDPTPDGPASPPVLPPRLDALTEHCERHWERRFAARSRGAQR